MTDCAPPAKLCYHSFTITQVSSSHFYFDNEDITQLLQKSSDNEWDGEEFLIRYFGGGVNEIDLKVVLSNTNTDSIPFKGSGTFVNPSDVSDPDNFFQAGKLIQFRQHQIPDNDGEHPEYSNDNISTSCVEQLKKFHHDTIEETFTFPVIDGKHNHNYEFSFQNDFVLEESCFDLNVWIGNTRHFPIIQDNKGTITFLHNQATQYGCEEVTLTEYQCKFIINLQFGGYVQQQKEYTSRIITPDLQDVNFSYKVDLIQDDQNIDGEDDQIDQSIENQIKFCPDINCSEYVNDLTFVRNEDIFAEFKVLTSGYDQFYPTHNTLKLNNIEIEPLNTGQLDNWSEKGTIRYRFQSPFAKTNTLLQISVKLTEELSSTRLRQLSEFEPINKNTGKKVYITVLDEEEYKHYQQQKRQQIQSQQIEKVDKKEVQDQNQLFYIILASLIVVLVISLTLIGVWYKLKKDKQQQNEKDDLDNNNIQKLQQQCSLREVQSVDQSNMELKNNIECPVISSNSIIQLDMQ